MLQLLVQAVGREGDATYWTERKQQKQAERLGVVGAQRPPFGKWMAIAKETVSLRVSWTRRKKDVKNLEGCLSMGAPPSEPHLGARDWKRGSWLKEVTRSMGGT